MVSDLYPNYCNPLIAKPERPLPKVVAVIGAGTIGPDIGYYLKSSLPDSALYLVDIVEKLLKDAQERIEDFLGSCPPGEYGIYREVARYRIDTQVSKETVDEQE